MAVERDAAIFAKVDAMIHAALEQHLVIQTFRHTLQPALSEMALPSEHRYSNSPEAVALQEAATPLDELSDGIQVFCGLIAAVAALPHVLLLVDEPEAFLHPTLCRLLGAYLARIARERDTRILAATHSASFLLGCIDEVPDTTVLRLDYRRGVAATHALPAPEVADLSRDPLLRSANALSALFARSAVVCEADADRAFYEEINRRLLEANGRRGALDCVFLNAQNRQTTSRIAAPLRSAGVPAAVVLDVDALASDDAWPGLIQAAGLTCTDRDRMLNARSAARDAIRACGKRSTAAGTPLRVKSEGLEALDETQRALVDTAVAQLATIGVFIVEVGELERWLPQLGCTNKQTWVTDMLRRLGARGDGAYVEPATGDVWAFVERIAHWLEDPLRHGMPDR